MQGEVLENVNLLLGAALLSVIHNLLPTHWLPFTLLARANKWSYGKTVAIVMLAGACHILSSIVLGILAALLGVEILGGIDIDTASSAILVIFGIVYIILHIADKHYHHHHELSEKATILGLVLALVFSPCEAVAIIYIPIATKGGQLLVLIMSVILIVVTVGLLVLLVTLSFLGIQKIKFQFLDQYEKLIIGVILCLVGISIKLLH